MARYKEHPRYHILSIRLSDQEFESLEELSKQSNKKVSELIREAIRIIVPQQMSA